METTWLKEIFKVLQAFDKSLVRKGRSILAYVSILMTGMRFLGFCAKNDSAAIFLIKGEKVMD